MRAADGTTTLDDTTNATRFSKQASSFPEGLIVLTVAAIDSDGISVMEPVEIWIRTGLIRETGVWTFPSCCPKTVRSLSRQLRAKGNDGEDGELIDDSVQWLASVDDVLDSGGTLTVSGKNHRLHGILVCICTRQILVARLVTTRRASTLSLFKVRLTRKSQQGPWSDGD